MIDAHLALKVPVVKDNRQVLIDAGLLNPHVSTQYLHLNIEPSTTTWNKQWSLRYEDSSYNGRTSITIKAEEFINVFHLLQLNARLPVEAYLGPVRIYAQHRTNFKNNPHWKHFPTTETE